MANLALSAKRTYEWLTDAYKAPRESAQASIDARKQIADFLANSNQPMDKDARFLAGTDAMTSLASQGTAFLAAGGYGRGKEAFSAFRNDQTAKIYRLIQEVNSRPGVQSDMAQMMQMLGVEAINKLNGRVEAVGREAKEMLGRTPGNIVAIKPMKDGVIADFEVTEKMLTYFIKKAHNRNVWVRPRIVIGVPRKPRK